MPTDYSYMDTDSFREARRGGREQEWHDAQRAEPQSEPVDDCVHFADGSGYRKGSGPAGPLYFDEFGNT